MTTLTRGQYAPLLHRSSPVPRSTLPHSPSPRHVFLRDGLRRGRADYYANLHHKARYPRRGQRSVGRREGVWWGAGIVGRALGGVFGVALRVLRAWALAGRSIRVPGTPNKPAMSGGVDGSLE